MKGCRLALQDIFGSILKFRVWFLMGSMDVKQRYRRTALGPWWISISLLVFVAAMGAVFSRVLKQPMADYIPFFTAGYLTWIFISGCLGEATEVFKNAAGFIKQVQLPFNVYIFKHLTRHVIFLMHNVAVLVLIFVVFRVSPSFEMLWAIPAFFLLVLNLYWLSLLVGLIGSRYRDLVPIMTNCIQIGFFVTPISWMPKLLAPNSFILKLNPFAYFISSIRDPLLGTAPTAEIWAGNLIIAGVGLLFALIMFCKYRSRLPFWVD